MEKKDVLEGKRILVVDDEPDILVILEEYLDQCVVDTAADFASARELLEKNPYDVAILDIMGVRGYDLLKLTIMKGIPTLMLTAHALSPDNLVKSLKNGASAYIPKDKIRDIQVFVRDVFEEQGKKKPTKLGKWFARLEPFFEEVFGAYWKDKSDPEFWKRYY